jgi:serine/threonine-protein kinase
VAIGLAALGGGVYVARHPVSAPQKEIAATEPPQPAPTPPAVDPTLRIRQGIRDFEGGDCFFALPTSVEATAAEIDGFGRAKEKFDALDAAFKKANGFEAQINVREVTPPQCPTLDFVRRFASLSDSVRLEVAKTKLHRLGDLLQGAIDSPLPHVRLLLVDDEGKVHDLSGQMAASGDRHDFAMRLQAQKPSPLLLVAIGANERIPIANPTQAQQAIDFFPPLVREMSDFAQTPTVAMKYIKLE